MQLKVPRLFFQVYTLMFLLKNIEQNQSTFRRQFLSLQYLDFLFLIKRIYILIVRLYFTNNCTITMLIKIIHVSHIEPHFLKEIYL